MRVLRYTKIIITERGIRQIKKRRRHFEYKYTEDFSPQDVYVLNENNKSRPGTNKRVSLTTSGVKRIFKYVSLIYLIHFTICKKYIRNTFLCLQINLICTFRY